MKKKVVPRSWLLSTVMLLPWPDDSIAHGSQAGASLLLGRKKWAKNMRQGFG
jgi:hypothetical protein